MTFRKALGLFGVATGLLVSSCGSDSPGDAGRCSGFTACGGDLVGPTGSTTWTVDPAATCVEGNLTAAVNINPNLPSSCHGAYQTVETTVNGTVTFTAGMATNDTVTTVSYGILVNAACASALGIASLSDATCALVGPALAPNLHESATCAMDAANCRCAALDHFRRNETLAYAVQGSTLNYTSGDQPMDFCVSGDQLSARQFTTELLSTVFFKATRSP